MHAAETPIVLANRCETDVDHIACESRGGRSARSRSHRPAASDVTLRYKSGCHARQLLQ